MNPLLLVKNAGFGETPIPKNALLQPGDPLTFNDDNDGSKTDGIVIAVVPKGGCIEYAIADQNKQPRPLVVSDNHSGQTLYVVEYKGKHIYIAQAQMKRGIDAAKAVGL
jgi:hypothetical protein